MSRLSASELGLSQDVYDALIWVRDAIDPEIPDHTLPSWMRFDMNHWGTASPNHSGCGTACCIGGSMQMHLAGLTSVDANHRFSWDEFDKYLALEDKVYRSDLMNPLFFNYPAFAGREKAVAAIDRFLSGETGNPWGL